MVTDLKFGNMLIIWKDLIPKKRITLEHKKDDLLKILHGILNLPGLFPHRRWEIYALKKLNHPSPSQKCKDTVQDKGQGIGQTRKLSKNLFSVEPFTSCLSHFCHNAQIKASSSLLAFWGKNGEISQRENESLERNNVCILMLGGSPLRKRLFGHPVK